jgi:hypothetical protein
MGSLASESSSVLGSPLSRINVGHIGGAKVTSSEHRDNQNSYSIHWVAADWAGRHYQGLRHAHGVGPVG